MDYLKPGRAVIIAAVLSGAIFGFAADAKLEQRIARGEARAILSTGQSGDRNYVPLLRKQLVSKNQRSRVAATLALAKLGERAERERIICWLRDSDPLVQQDGIEGIAYVGGWYAISEFRKLLDVTERNTKPRYRGHEVFLSFQAEAIRRLPSIVGQDVAPGFDPVKTPARIPHIAADWRAWIDGNKTDLKGRPPEAAEQETCSASK